MTADTRPRTTWRRQYFGYFGFIFVEWEEVETCCPRYKLYIFYLNDTRYSRGLFALCTTALIHINTLFIDLRSACFFSVNTFVQYI